MSDLNQLTGSTPSLADVSIWLIVKMCARLSLKVTRARLAIKIAPRTSILSPKDLFRVECGALALAINTVDLAASRSPSKRRTRRKSTDDPGSTSMATTPPETGALPLDALFSRTMSDAGSQQDGPRAFEP